MTLTTRLAGLVGLFLVTGCPQQMQPCVEGDEPTCDGGTLPSDGCNSPEEAKSNPSCRLTLCQDLEAFISTVPDGGADVDFYVVTLPGDLTAQSLLQVRGGYGGVPQTAVNFSLNVLQAQPDGGFATVATGNDRRMGAATPKSVDIVQPFSQSNAELLIRVSDVGGVVQPRVDNRNPYKLSVCTLTNPDQNEPNDTTPTPVQLTANGGVQTGTSSGYLATNDDKDVFSFAVSGPRQIIYMRVSSMMMNLMPPLAYRLAYVLKDPMGRPVSEGQMDNEFLQVDLSTARLAPMDGTYTVELFGFKTPQQMTPALGDIRLKYDLELRVMPDLDMNEGSMGNDTAANARSVNLALNAPTTLTGRLSYVPDADWFRLVLPGGRGTATLRYELLPVGSGGRFPPLSTIPSRQIRVIQEITTGMTLQDQQTNCANNAAVCPRSFSDPTMGTGALVTSLCRSGVNPPQCLLAERNEEFQLPPFRAQKNFVGALPVPPNVTSLLFVYSDPGRGRIKWADDVPWSIRVTLESDPDETPPVRGPVTLSTANAEVSGVLTHGYGGLTEEFEDLNEGRGIRGPNDYDATTTDRDTFLFNYGGATGTQSWAFEFLVGDVDGGGRPAGTFGVELNFCESRFDGGCAGGRRALIPQFNGFAPWYVTSPTLADTRVHFTQSRVGNATLIRVEPVACSCISAARVASMQLEMTAIAVDRTANDPIPYTIRQRIGAYPTNFTSPDGGAATCPLGTIGRDGGVMGDCGFAR